MCWNTSGPNGMLVSGGHNRATGVRVTGVASWGASYFNLVSGGGTCWGYRGMGEGTKAGMPVESPIGRHGQWEPYFTGMDR